MKNLVVDLDDTISFTNEGDYLRSIPNYPLVDKLREYKLLNFTITINTSRNMRTFKGNVGKINVETLPNIINWLNHHEIPYDEIYVGKPWCGFEGFYIDDKSIRPSEFVKYSYEEIIEILNNEKKNKS